MIHPPSPWQLSEDTSEESEEIDFAPERYRGGFLTDRLGHRFPITRGIEQQYRRMDAARFRPSPGAIEAINHLQETRWTADERLAPLIRATIQHQVTERIQNRLHFRTDGERLIADIIRKPGDDFQALPGALSIHEWLDELYTVHSILDVPEADGTFYHAWHFDWRGRMYPRSSVLSPQGDDVSRGLLRFKDSRQLDEQGWRFLRLYVASLWRGRKDSEGNPLAGTSTGKDEASLMEAVNSEAFLKLARSVAESVADEETVMDAFDLWGRGDVLDSKTTGFQRVAATLAFVDAIDATHGAGVGAPCNLPVVLDGSTNIYQHAAMLMRDRKMAMEVNVLLNPDLDSVPGQPADLYTRVAEKVRDNWTEPFMKLKDTMDETVYASLVEQIVPEVTKRSLAKRPVMTVAYGAGKKSMTESLLSHNGETRRNGGKFHYCEREEGDKNPPYCAHPLSALGGILDLVPPEHHYGIGREIIKQYVKAIEAILPNFKEMKNALKKLVSRGRHVWLPEDYWDCDDNGCVKDMAKTKEKIQLWLSDNGIEHPMQPDESKAKKIVKAALEEEVANSEESQDIASMLKEINLLDWLDDHDIEVPMKYDPDAAKIVAVEELKHTLRNVPLQWQTPFGKRIFKKDGSQLSRTGLGGVSVRNLRLDSGEPIKDQEWKFIRESMLATEREEFDGHAEIVRNILGAKKDELDLTPLFEERKNRQRRGEIWQNIATSVLGEGGADAITQSGKLKGRVKRDLQNFDRKLAHSILKIEGLTRVRTISYHRLSENIDVDGELQGISPNFVHSLDATHMRLVLGGLVEIQRSVGQNTSQLWSVHDAFGAHPNDIQAMRRSVVEKLVETHADVTVRGDNTAQGPLDLLHHQVLERPLKTIFTMDSSDRWLRVDDVRRIEDGDPVNPYVVWF